MWILSAHQQKIMLQNNNIYPGLITMLLVYLAYSELRFQFHKRLYVQVSTAFAKKRTHFSLDSFQVQASRVEQLYFVLQKCTSPDRFGDGLICSLARHPRSTGEPVLSFRPPLCPCVVLMFPHVLTSKPVALTLTGRQPGTHTFP